MTKLLFVAAIEKEIEPLKAHLSSDPDCAILITGVGMVNTAMNLCDHLHTGESPDLIINAGIAGAFSQEIVIGEVVQVTEDRFSELGVGDNEQFVPADEVGFMKTEELVFTTDRRISGMPEVTGITVNRVLGNKTSIDHIASTLNPAVESMEGAAVAVVAQKFGIPWLQIRAISNHVEPRDTSKWNIPLAIKNLNTTLINLLEELK